MAHITAANANAWLEGTKLTLTTIEPEMERQIANLVFARLRPVFPTETWTDDTNTPSLVKTLIAMYYVSWLYNKTYSDDDEANIYASILQRTAENNIDALIAGTITLEEFPDVLEGVGSPTFFPNDLSSANEPTADFPSDGGPAFVMGTVW